MQQQNFVVSGLTELRATVCAETFVLEPYVYYDDPTLRGVDGVSCAPTMPCDARDLVERRQFVHQRYERYVALLAPRLDAVHGIAFGRAFWDKALSMGLMLHIAFLYEQFLRYEAFFDPDRHSCRILSNRCVRCFDGYYDFKLEMLNSPVGWERAFAIYVRALHTAAAARFPEVTVPPPQVPIAPLSEAPPKVSLVARLIKWLLFRRPLRVGVFQSCFGARHVRTLVRRSLGSIRRLDLDTSPPSTGGVDTLARAALAATTGDDDRFDTFFLASLTSCLPRTFVECFRGLYERFDTCFSSHPHLRHVVNESWISGDSFVSLALAVAAHRGVRIVTPEHTSVYRMFACNAYSFVASHSTFVTMGWEPSAPAMIRGGCLFDHLPPVRTQRSHAYPLTFADRIHLAKSWDYTCFLLRTESGRASFEFVRAFFAALPRRVRERVNFRGHPQFYRQRRWLCYDLLALEPTMCADFAKVNDFDEPFDVTLRKTRLLVTPVLSTTYVQGFMADVPTIAFLDTDVDALDPHDGSVLEPLIRTGIVQTDPSSAASFVERIVDDPDQWWGRDDVQQAKNAFLAENFLPEEAMYRLLLSLSGEVA